MQAKEVVLLSLPFATCLSLEKHDATILKPCNQREAETNGF